MRRRCAAESGTEITPDPDSGPEPDTAGGVVQERLEQQREEHPNPFTLLTHKPNYLLPVAWNQRGWDPTVYREANDDPDYTFDDFELQFQLSIKVPLAVGLFDDRVDLYAAYTNRSFWQAYDSDNSQPFRETNHEPELWVQFPGFGSVFGFRNVLNRVGYVHQSNGKSEPLSRGWDRIYVDFIFERGDWALSFRPWLRVDPSGSSDNPDIEDYLGHGDMRVAWAPDDSGHVFSLMLRNQIESGFDEGAAEFSWSFPLFDYPWVKGYLQYFYGYGESLVDYDQRVNRIGIGLSFSDWLY